MGNVVDANSSTGEPEGLFAGWKVSRITPSRMHDGSVLPGSRHTLARPCCLVTEASRIHPCGRQKMNFGKIADVEEELLVSRLSALKQVCEYTMDMEANRTRSAVDITAAEMVAHEHGDATANKGYRCYAPSSGCAFNLCESQGEMAVR